MDIDTQTYQPGVRSHGTDVPAGHIKSDLSPTSCSLVLGRRRDLTLRGDIKLSRGNHTATLNQLLKASLGVAASSILSDARNRSADMVSDMQKGVSIVFGVPDMGPVCSEQHVPGYLKKVWQSLHGCVHAAAVGWHAC